MKKMIFTMLAFTYLSQAFSAPQDIFFKGDKNFIKIDKVSEGLQIFVQYAGCKLNDDGKTALCKNIAKISFHDFKLMGDCLQASEYGARFGDVAAVGLMLASGTGVGVFAGAGLFIYTSHVQNNLHVKKTVFDPNIIHYHFTYKEKSGITYNKFVDKLERSLNDLILTCDVHDGSVNVDKETFWYRLK